MELASSMLFSAVSNASQETRDELFKKLRFHFGNIFDLAICRSGSQVAEYFTKYRNKIDEIFMGLEDDQDSESMLQSIISNDIRIAVANGCFADSALDHFQYYQLNAESKMMQIILKTCFYIGVYCRQFVLLHYFMMSVILRIAI